MKTLIRLIYLILEIEIRIRRGTALNPSTFVGIRGNSPQNNGFFRCFGLVWDYLIINSGLLYTK